MYLFPLRKNSIFCYFHHFGLFSLFLFLKIDVSDIGISSQDITDNTTTNTTTTDNTNDNTTDNDNDTNNNTNTDTDVNVERANELMSF